MGCLHTCLSFYVHTHMHTHTHTHTQGEVTIEGSFDGGISYRNSTHPKGVELGSLGGFSDAFEPQMKVFVEQIVGGCHGNSESGERALREVMLAQATYKSLKTKQWEKVSLDNLT